MGDGGKNEKEVSGGFGVGMWSGGKEGLGQDQGLDHGRRFKTSFHERLRDKNSIRTSLSTA